MIPPQGTLPHRTKATRFESVTFTDGMIVTADDLQTAMHYPAAMLKTVLRSYFGCGVVCGFELEADPDAGDCGTYALCVGAGVAFDCHGYPLELCGSVKLDLRGDPCDQSSRDVVIAIRRATSDEAPHNPCTCDTDDPRFECTRAREHVVVGAFLPDEIDDKFCRRVTSSTRSDQGSDECEPPADENGGTVPPTPLEALCECLKDCTSCHCAAESWVHLGTVHVTGDGIDKERFDLGPRRYVKPIECLCTDIPNWDSVQEQIKTLEARLTKLEPEPPSRTTHGDSTEPL